MRFSCTPGKWHKRLLCRCQAKRALARLRLAFLRCDGVILQEEKDPEEQGQEIVHQRAINLPRSVCTTKCRDRSKRPDADDKVPKVHGVLGGDVKVQKQWWCHPAQRWQSTTERRCTPAPADRCIYIYIDANSKARQLLAIQHPRFGIGRSTGSG